MPYLNVTRTIRQIRHALGLTQEQFAAKVGVTFSTVNRWENGRGTPSPLARRRIEELSEGLDVHLRRNDEEDSDEEDRHCSDRGDLQRAACGRPLRPSRNKPRQNEFANLNIDVSGGKTAMKGIDIKQLGYHLSRSLEGAADEVESTPPPSLADMYERAMRQVQIYPGDELAVSSSPTYLRKIVADRESGTMSSTKVWNIVLRPLDWLDVGWKTASTAAAVPTFGAWAAVGFVLVIRDLMKLFDIRLTMAQGEVIHILAGRHEADSLAMKLDDLTEALNHTFDKSYEPAEVKPVISQLVRLKCVTHDLDMQTVTLVEKVEL